MYRWRRPVRSSASYSSIRSQEKEENLALKNDEPQTLRVLENNAERARRICNRAGLHCSAAVPFTPVIAAASAFQYSRRKLLLLAFVARLARFSIVAALALIFGRQILSIARSTAFFGL
jgi:membrane protein YqaA with SNARE-associated domain